MQGDTEGDTEAQREGRGTLRLSRNLEQPPTTGGFLRRTLGNSQPPEICICVLIFVKILRNTHYTLLDLPKLKFDLKHPSHGSDRLQRTKFAIMIVDSPLRRLYRLDGLLASLILSSTLSSSSSSSSYSSSSFNGVPHWINISFISFQRSFIF